jgi:hypothetical protein
MKLTPSKCPTCGGDANWILETVHVMSGVYPVGENEESDWSESKREVLWDSVHPTLIDGKVTAHCVEEHKWLAEMKS